MNAVDIVVGDIIWTHRSRRAGSRVVQVERNPGRVVLTTADGYRRDLEWDNIVQTFPRDPLADRLDHMAEMCERAARTRHADTAVGAASASRWCGRAAAYAHAARLLRGGG